MRITLVSSRFFPQLVGSGTSAYTIAKGLSERGHEVTVLTDSSLRALHRSQPLPFVVRYIPNLESFAVGIASMREPLDTLHTQLDELKPDVLHVCNFMPMLLCSILRPHIRCPIVFTFFNTPRLGKRAIGYSKEPEVDLVLGRFIIETRAYDKLMVGSQHYYNATIELGATPEDVTLSYIGIDEKPFLEHTAQVRGPLFQRYIGNQLTETDEYIILPSRVTKQKGIVEAVEALAIVRKRHPIKLLLTGMANPFDEAYAILVRSTAAQLGVGDDIIQPLTHISREDLPHFFSHARLAIVPSYYEGLGMAAIEALAIGTPLVASDTVGLNEVAQNGINSLTCKPRDPVSLAEAITKMIENPEMAARLSLQGRQSSRRFYLSEYIHDLEHAYESVAETVRQ